MTLVATLRQWIEDSRDRLALNRTSITDKLPGREDNEQNKGCVGLSRDHILVSFTAWDRKPFPIELLVYNTRIGRAVIVRDENKSSIESVVDALNEVAG